ncbi:hypothetical protein EYZ11_009753 [Aspergillus tanneri]|uniref:Uncharacterized protein n=1 Tax=Aspergillus tanneri TaxID=1220188 RepID=A0A4S3J7B7_9EURO|nr:hypothetical protein EYZ11_009753 [Aspergillus tanneri]
MKLFFTVLLGCLPLALADFIIVTFPKNTPDRVVKEARQAIIDAGGEITHDYREYPVDLRVPHLKPKLILIIPELIK